jgi:hypothetical protein
MESGNHYVYVVTSSGYLYKIRDYGSLGGGGLSTVGGTFYYHNSDGDTDVTATSPLAMDSSNVYWTGNDSGASPKVFGVARSTGSAIASPQALVANSNGALALTNLGGTIYLFLGSSAGTIYKKPNNFSGGSSITPAGATAITSAIIIHDTTMMYGETGGVLRARTTDLGSLWLYTNANASAVGGIYYHSRHGRVYYGDAVGKMYAVVRDGSTSSGKVLSTNYPYQPAGTTGASDSILVAPVYAGGVTAYGTSTGKVVFVDAQNGSDQPALIHMYHFGSAVSSIAYETVTATTGNFLIGTANGRLHVLRRDTADSTTMMDPTDGNP